MRSSPPTGTLRASMLDASAAWDDPAMGDDPGVHSRGRVAVFDDFRFAEFFGCAAGADLARVAAGAFSSTSRTGPSTTGASGAPGVTLASELPSLLATFPRLGDDEVAVAAVGP
jgi:hypothetical protein